MTDFWHERLFPPTAGNSFATEQQGEAGDPEANRTLRPPPMDMNELIRAAAGVRPESARPPLTGAQMFVMTPAQVAAYQGAPAAPAGIDFGGGQRGESVTPPPRDPFRELLESAVSLQRSRREGY